MIHPHTIAARILGAIDWQSEVSGFCRCPGEALHTHRTGKKDCRVNVDGAPTIYCFHSSCAPAVAEANRRLRRELGASLWALTLPGGRVLRNGDVLQGDGTVKTRAEIERGPAGGTHGGTATGRMHCATTVAGGTHCATTAAAERLVVETVRVMAERFRPELF